MEKKTLVNQCFLTESGKEVRIKVEFDEWSFTTRIDINRKMVSENRSFIHEPEKINPMISDVEKIYEVNNLMIELSEKIKNNFKG